MKVKQLIQALQKVKNQNASVELSRFFAITDDKEVYDCHLDFPIIGFAEKDDEVLLLVHHAKEITGLKLKEITRLDNEG